MSGRRAMTLYGLYARDPDAGDLVWFTAADSLQPGRYILGRPHDTSPNVYVAESIPSLILQVGSVVQQAERGAQSSLGTADMTPDAQQRLADEMIEGLLRRLTETSSIWVANPPWLKDLAPCP